jgi:hypothetical protein
MVVKGGATGCVFGYNYSFNTYQTAGFLAPDMFIHGCHANMNLFEGNYGTKMNGDNLHGSGAYNTYFRNFATRVSTSETITSGRWPAVMDVELNYQNFVGNILGQSNLTWTAEDSGSTRTGSGTYEWTFGFQSDGGTTQVSTQTESTTLRHGNYEDYNHQIVWDPAISDHTIPASLYLASRPAFFGSNPWPAIGPDLSPIVGICPAVVRYAILSGATRPPAPTNLRIISHVP